MKKLILLLTLTLVNCAPTGPLKGSGQGADAPQGYTAYCLRHPLEPICRAK